jgi:hypothetical protein
MEISSMAVAMNPPGDNCSELAAYLRRDTAMLRG